MTSALLWSLNLLILQGLMGAFDTIYHHEITEALPARPGARRELAIHALRALLYGVVFAGIGRYRLQGAWLGALAALIAVEIGLTLWDFVVEDRTRKLPSTERVLHTVLAINGGALFGLYAFACAPQLALPTALLPADYGWRGIVLQVLAVGVALSGLRDALAAGKRAPADDTPNPFDAVAPGHVLVTGGTGFIGSKLMEQLLAAGHAVTVLSRQRLAAYYRFGGRANVVASFDEIPAGLRIDTVVNLAGAPVVGPRWSATRKTVLLGSRVGLTHKLVAWLRSRSQRPALLVNGSAVGFYGVRPADEPLPETAAPGTGFMTELCQEWEKAAEAVDALGLRRVALRFGLVMGPSNGLPALLLPIRLGLGGRMGDGRQMMSWIHRDDVLALIARAMADESMQGAYNAVAPQAVSQAEFVHTAGRLLHRPVWLPLPAAPMRLVMGEMAQIFFDGQRVVPQRLIDAGFAFRYPTLEAALKREI